MRLVADVDLKEAVGPAVALVHRAAKRGDERRAVDRMDHIEQADGVLRLVRLQLPDEMERDTRIGITQRGPFGLRFLHAILAERALAGDEQGLDRFGGLGL